MTAVTVGLFWVSFITAPLVFSVYAHLTNPFVKRSIIKSLFEVEKDQAGQLLLRQHYSLIVKNSIFHHVLAKLKCGYHIVINRFAGSKPATGKTIEEIIAEIHAVRFDQKVPFIISGDHFSVLYPRSLGIFYHTTLDKRTAYNEDDWTNRQALYLKTLSYALESFKNSPYLTTTITPIGARAVSLVNFHRAPSDTLYSLLYGLMVVRDASLLEKIYPFLKPSSLFLATTTMADRLIKEYRESLARHVDIYTQTVYDSELGLVKKNILLSGTKDMSKRSSAFYDNVIFWKTHQLAQELGIVKQDLTFLAALKQRILTHFWLEEEGYFVEDLSDEALDKKHYSSDWLVVQKTGFLDPHNPQERTFLERSIDYIQRVGLDVPFGLWYQKDLLAHRQYSLIRWLSPDYGTTSIWSHWGMEYTKLLAHLAQLTGSERYLDRAEKQIAAYSENIIKFKGFPELYQKNGQLYTTLLYKSVRRTGWVVNFEQAREMVRWTRQQWSHSQNNKQKHTRD